LTRADVENHLQEAAQKEPELELAQPVPLTNVSQDKPHEELIPLTPARRLIGKRMLQSITTAPHIYLDMEIDMAEAERCRQSIGRSMEDQGEPALSLTALIVRATAAAIVLHPMVNAVFEEGALEGKDAIRQRQEVHIGIAVDTERALLTPVIRNAHQLNAIAISRELRRLTQAARQETLLPDELAGATFTISNLGMYDIDTFHAIIVPGQSSILAVGKVTKRGVVIEEEDGDRLEIRPVMKVSLSADHRVLDGAGGSRFLRQLKMFLETPYLLL
jgi:pyruvate/2-oxoglutarate dehydrogenase complex dihydrolipoamide acyltransferase (E2) component